MLHPRPTPPHQLTELATGPGRVDLVVVAVPSMAVAVPSMAVAARGLPHGETRWTGATSWLG
jgi:hypothetical protein